MGWAARAKQQQGNSKPNPLKVLYITQQAFSDAMRRGHKFRVTYSDREYVMDAHGTLRRLQPTAKTFSIRNLDDPTAR